jgi:hypothetical protein
LERVDEAQNFVDRSTDRQVVDRHLQSVSAPLLSELRQGRAACLSYDPPRVNYEQPPQRDAFLFNQHAVVFAELVVLVAQQRDVDAAEPAVTRRCVVPRQQAVFGVCGREDDGRVAAAELWRGVAESDDLGRADECPGHGNEGEDEPLLGGGVSCEGEVCEGWYR